MIGKYVCLYIYVDIYVLMCSLYDSVFEEFLKVQYFPNPISITSIHSTMIPPQIPVPSFYSNHITKTYKSFLHYLCEELSHFNVVENITITIEYRLQVS